MALTDTTAGVPGTALDASNGAASSTRPSAGRGAGLDAHAAPRPRGRVAVALSGGVDSSVAAALLVEQGWDVVGVHMKLHDAPEHEQRARSCCSLDDSLDARQVCDRLGIPFYVLDLRERFKARVIDYFVEAYRRGSTPNPCVMCNQAIKNATLLETVRSFGCEYLATGHYAHVEQNAEGSWQLVRPADRRKDQTYFLFSTPRCELPHLLYPLAQMEKPQARGVAERHGFVTWDKPDSQEVCFVPKDYRSFLEEHLAATPPLPGPFVDADGRELGVHRGLPFYTVGQRRGLGLSSPQPFYVIALRPEQNTVVLGPEEALYRGAMDVSAVNWVSCEPPTEPLRATVKVRYAHEGQTALLEPAVSSRGGSAAAEGAWRVTFDAPVRAVAPGQAAVFYDGDVLLGGGWIEPPDRG